ncbi:hypothetical protein Q8791_29010 [Nocardiopsis sp. CT-R113]|uniref:Helix-turn-helix domain-containing protein n=1 Tax=Nocardiopsis codii TaxID=3065942 RepID=A0ABU7KGZ5_9ACTN|nr:hypothetical protein [Nocardiopsis sp. CT-R113]MEE2041272.1 hypothetical protein [Nocardiopsis sp. CT-R113]
MATADHYPAIPRYAGTADVARALEVRTQTVTNWLNRYPPTSSHPCPAPDVIVGDVLGWEEKRLPEWVTWRAGMPGRGAGGGRPRKTTEQEPDGPPASGTELLRRASQQNPENKLLRGLALEMEAVERAAKSARAEWRHAEE